MLRIVSQKRLTLVEMALYRRELRALRRVAGRNVYLQFAVMGVGARRVETRRALWRAVPLLYGPSDRVNGLARKDYELVVLAKPELEVLKWAQGEPRKPREGAARQKAGGGRGRRRKRRR